MLAERIKKKGQVANEAIFAIGFILLFFLMIFAIISQRSSQFVNTKVNLEQRELCLKISTGINEIYSKGHGTVLQLDLKNHTVSFNGKDQVLEIDNGYRCTIPLKEISDGGSNIFTIEQGKIQIANLENVVYINSKCVTNRVNFAQDNNLQVVTDLVRDLDNKRAKVDLTRYINDTISNLTAYLIQNNIRIAYVTESSGVDVCANNQLQTYLSTDYQCKDYPNPSNTFCDRFSSSGDFWSRISNYSIIFLENIESISDNKATLENWVTNGGALILLGKISNADTSVLGINYNKLQNPPSNLKATADYYQAVADGIESFLLMGGSVSNPAIWPPKRGHYITNTTNAFVFIKEGTYNNGNIGLARWNYGSGFSYFFSSCLEDNNNDTYNFGNFTQRIRESIQRMVGTYYSGFLDTKFLNNEKVGATINNISTTLQHHMEGLENVQELNIYNTTLGNYTKICDLSNSTTEITEVCNIPSSTILGNEVKFRIGARVKKININKSAFYNYQDLRVCYEEIP